MGAGAPTVLIVIEDDTDNDDMLVSSVVCFDGWLQCSFNIPLKLVDM